MHGQRLLTAIGVSFLLLNLALTGLPAGVTAAAHGDPSLDIRRIRQQARSKLVLGSGRTAVEIFLHAPDEQTEILRGDYCGGNEGAKEYSGNYRLIAVRKDGSISSVLYLGERVFTQGRIEGMEEFRIPGTKHRLIALYQYRGCNGDGLEFYRVDGAGQIRLVQFHNKDGVKKSDVFGGHGAGATKDGHLGFCGYNNAVALGSFCDDYKFNGDHWVQTRSSFIQANPDEPASVSEARRALFELFINLYHGRYETAAFYYGGVDESVNPNNANASRTKRAEMLRQYCTTAWQTCLIPEGLEFKRRDPSGVLEFDVSFVSLETGASFVTPAVRVRPRGGDFEVLDLPRRDNP
jgi:hypothetical protein